MGVWVSGWAAGESGSRAHGSRGGGDGASRARTRGGRGRNEGDLKSVRASRRCGEPRRPLSPLPPPRPRPGPGAGSGRAPRAGGAAQWQRPRWLRAGAVPRRPEARPGKFVACPARRGGELAAPEQSGTWGRGRGGSGAPFAAHAQLGNGSGGNAGGGGGGEGQGGASRGVPGGGALCSAAPRGRGRGAPGRGAAPRAASASRAPPRGLLFAEGRGRRALLFLPSSGPHSSAAWESGRWGAGSRLPRAGERGAAGGPRAAREPRASLRNRRGGSCGASAAPCCWGGGGGGGHGGGCVLGPIVPC